MHGATITTVLATMLEIIIIGIMDLINLLDTILVAQRDQDVVVESVVVEEDVDGLEVSMEAVIPLLLHSLVEIVVTSMEDVTTLVVEDSEEDTFHHIIQASTEVAKQNGKIVK